MVHGYRMMVGWWWVVPVLVMALFIWISYLMTRGPRIERDHRTPEPESGMEILKKRYAKGEISQEEFKRIQKDL